MGDSIVLLRAMQNDLNCLDMDVGVNMDWFKNKCWNLKALISAIAVVAVGWAVAFSSIFGPFLPYIWAPKSNDDNNSAFVGLWYEEYEYPDRGGVVRFKGTTEFFGNKSYSVSGLMQFESVANNKPFSIYFDVDATGEWQGSEKELIAKITHMTSPLSSVEVGGVKFTSEQYKKFTGSTPPDFSSALLMGRSQAYKVLSVNDNKVELETGGLHADTMKIVMNRTKQVYLH